MMQRCYSLALAAVLCYGTSPLAAQNLLQNGTFDTHVVPWEGLFSPPTFSPVDSWGFPNSGSMRGSIEHPSANKGNNLQSECIEVTGGTSYVRDYVFRLESADDVLPFVHAQINWFSDPACGSPLSVTGGQAWYTADGFWHFSHEGTRAHTAPLDARGARLGLVVAKTEAGGAAVAHFDGVVFKVAGTCAALSDVLCLNQERFQVEAFWQTATDVGRAAVVKLTNDTGYLWFFGPDNVEVVIKVLDACDTFGRFWVFAAGLTDVKVEITVRDTKSGEVKVYANPLGVPFQPVQDTDAFDTCP